MRSLQERNLALACLEHVDIRHLKHFGSIFAMIPLNV